MKNINDEFHYISDVLKNITFEIKDQFVNQIEDQILEIGNQISVNLTWKDLRII